MRSFEIGFVNGSGCAAGVEGGRSRRLRRSGLGVPKGGSPATLWVAVAVLATVVAAAGIAAENLISIMDDLHDLRQTYYLNFNRGSTPATIFRHPVPVPKHEVISHPRTPSHPFRPVPPPPSPSAEGGGGGIVGVQRGHAWGQQERQQKNDHFAEVAREPEGQQVEGRHDVLQHAGGEQGMEQRERRPGQGDGQEQAEKRGGEDVVEQEDLRIEPVESILTTTPNYDLYLPNGVKPRFSPADVKKLIRCPSFIRPIEVQHVRAGRNVWYTIVLTKVYGQSVYIYCR